MQKITTILILFVALSSQAQKFSGGVFCGISGSQISGDNYSGFNKAGINAGLTVNYMISEKHAITMDLCFIQKGSKNNANPEKGIFNSYKLSLSYFEIPIYIRFNANQKLFFDLGLSYGRLIKSIEKDQYGEISGTRQFNNSDYCLIAGLGILLKKQISASFRFSNSFLPVRSHASNATFLLNKGQYNTVLTLNFVYQFKIHANKTKT
jgi:hypothetical protein